MKIKKAMGIATAFASAVMMTSAVHAATYSISSATVAKGDTVTLKVTVSPDGDNESAQLNGYAMNIKYDAAALKPVTYGKDVTGADLYAKNSLGLGVIVSEPVANGNSATLSLAWADTAAKTITSNTQIAELKFTALPETTITSANLALEVIETASSDTSIDEKNTVHNGTVTITEASSSEGEGGSGSGSGGSGSGSSSSSDSNAAVLSTASATLEGKIGVNFYLTLPDSVVNDSNAYALFTKGTDTQKVLVKDAYKTTSGSDTLYGFTYYTVAKELRDNVNIKLYTGSNTLVTLKGTSGKDYTSTGADLSLMTYLEGAKSKTTNSKMYALAEAVEDYGTAAQIYFDYDASGRSVSSKVTSVQLSDLNSYKASASGSLPDGVTGFSASVMFEADNSLRFYYDYAANAKPTSYTYTIDGFKTNLKQTSAGDYYIEVSNIAAKELDKAHSFTVTDGNKVHTVNLSVISYAGSIINSSDKESGKNLGKALYLYNKAAKDYFNS